MKLKDVLNSIVDYNCIEVVIETELNESFVHWCIYDYNGSHELTSVKQIYQCVYFPDKSYVMCDELNHQFDLLSHDVSYIEAVDTKHLKICCYMD